MLVDPTLIERARAGDEGAFNEVVLAYRRRVLGTIYRLIGHRDDVEDVGQAEAHWVERLGYVRPSPGSGSRGRKGRRGEKEEDTKVSVGGSDGVCYTAGAGRRKWHQQS